MFYDVSRIFPITGDAFSSLNLTFYQTTSLQPPLVGRPFQTIAFNNKPVYWLTFSTRTSILSICLTFDSTSVVHSEYDIAWYINNYNLIITEVSALESIRYLVM